MVPNTPHDIDALAQRLVAALRERANQDNVAGMARFGISSRGTLGVSVAEIRALASEAKRELGRDRLARQQLAEVLWASGVHEAAIMASVLAEPTVVTRDTVERWVLDLDSWDTCDQLCGNLLWRTPFAWDLPAVWCGRPETFVKRAGFVVAAQLGGKDKVAANEQYGALLDLVVREATDERNDVKKGANWALRQIGKRNAACNALAIATGERILELYPQSRSARWIARDALRELRSDAVRRRLGIG